VNVKRTYFTPDSGLTHTYFTLADSRSCGLRGL